jgi:hypothetical protein
VLRRCAGLFAVLAAVACGGPSTPSVPPTPPPPVYPNMLGGWGGTQADTWVSLDGSVTGARTCSETWLITSQTNDRFSGAFQRTPGSSDACARSGTISGSVLSEGTIELGHSDTGVSGGCPLVSGDPVFRGVLSQAGNITAGTIIVLRCPFGNGTIDYRYTTSVAVSRR